MLSPIIKRRKKINKVKIIHEFGECKPRIDSYGINWCFGKSFDGLHGICRRCHNQYFSGLKNIYSIGKDDKELIEGYENIQDVKIKNSIGSKLLNLIKKRNKMIIDDSRIDEPLTTKQKKSLSDFYEEIPKETMNNFSCEINRETGEIEKLGGSSINLPVTVEEFIRVLISSIEKKDQE